MNEQLGESFFSYQHFLPQGHSFLWRPEILWLYVISDGIIFLSYMIIPVTLVLAGRRTATGSARWVLYMFGGLITLCGLTHLASIYTIWVPAYGFEGLLKALTAAISISTAALLIPIAPKALRWLREVDRNETLSRSNTNRPS